MAEIIPRRELPSLEFIEIVPDPIWTEIPITELELDIIRSNIFKRLRHIKQMGLAYLKYPGANHSRYEHSLGTCHAAGLLFDILCPNMPKELGTEACLIAVRIAALLHDLGHPPYSHVVEEAFKKYPELLDVSSKAGKNAGHLKRIIQDPEKYSHESFTKYIIDEDKELGEIIDYAFKKTPNFPKEVISALAIGEADDKWEGIAPFNPIISGDLDCDKIDYILRDSYYCGLSNNFKIKELRGYLAIEEDQYTKKKRLFLRHGSTISIGTMLLARYKLIKEVHLERNNRISTQLLIELIYKSIIGLNPDQRAEKILEMHLKWVSADFDRFLFEVSKEPHMVKNILDGTVLEYFGEISKINFEEMHPALKASTYVVLSDPRAVCKLQRTIRETLGSDSLIIDIKEPKLPTFRVLVKDASDEYGRIIFDKHFVPHGILIDSINDLTVYIYDMKKSDYEKKSKSYSISDNDRRKVLESLPSFKRIVADKIILTAKEIRNERSKKGQLLDCEFLLCVLSALDEYSIEKLAIRPEMDGWAFTDTALQRFIKQVIEDLEKKYKNQVLNKYDWDGNFSIGIFIDFERLYYMALIDQINKLVGYKSNISNTKAYWFRTDRKISGWGKGYVKSEIQDSYINVFRAVKERQDQVLQFLQEITQASIKGKSLTSKLEEKEKINNIINETKNKIIKGGGCPIIL